MIIDPIFKKKIPHIDLESIQKSDDITCIVDSNMAIRAYNNAWMAFPKNNNASKVLAKFSIGSIITEAGVEPIKSYIQNGYYKALNENILFEFTYECSSDSVFRLFHQTAYPLLNAEGLVISHHLAKERKHTEKEHEFNKQFFNQNGLITQCQNCRKIRDPENANRWLWVPSLVKSPIPKISHGICDRCLEHYYPDILLEE